MIFFNWPNGGYHCNSSSTSTGRALQRHRASTAHWAHWSLHVAGCAAPRWTSRVVFLIQLFEESKMAVRRVQQQCSHYPEQRKFSEGLGKPDEPVRGRWLCELETDCTIHTKSIHPIWKLLCFTLCLLTLKSLFLLISVKKKQHHIFYDSTLGDNKTWKRPERWVPFIGTELLSWMSNR